MNINDKIPTPPINWGKLLVGSLLIVMLIMVISIIEKSKTLFAIGDIMGCIIAVIAIIVSAISFVKNFRK